MIDAGHLRKGYGDRLLIDDLDFRLPPGGIVGVIGPNGAGKTTLFRMILGQEKPDAGALRVGDTSTLRYVDQSRDALAANKSVWEEISRRPRHHPAGQARGQQPRLRRRVQLSRARPAAEGPALRRRAQPRAPRQAPEGRRQRHSARRADQRPRRRHAARAGRRAVGLRRLRRDHQPRPLVPRPHRDPHPGVRGRQPRRVVRGQLPGLRGRPQTPPRQGRSAAPIKYKPLKVA